MRYLLLLVFAAITVAGCKSPTQPGASVEDEINAARPIQSVTVYQAPGSSVTVFQAVSLSNTTGSPTAVPLKSAYATNGFLIVEDDLGTVYTFSLSTSVEAVVVGHSVTLYY